MRKELLFLMLLPAAGLSTGAVAQEPPENVPVPLSIRSAVTTSTEGLTEEFGISGRLVRLEGRFRSLATATVNNKGEVITRCQGPGEVTETSAEATDE